MWIKLEDKEVELLKGLLPEMAAGERRDAQLFWNDDVAGNKEAREACVGRAEQYEALANKIIAREAEAGDPIDAAYRNAVETNDDLEVDEDAIVTHGADAGAWVHAWVWVTDEKAGIEPEEEGEETEGDDA
ncbi:hypothetical protein [Brucella intermedia]|uniref:hypothetical protein n=1 Tax=Brucella intermedia TaxID=94625 RepID=UPI00224B902C|nr:hypothetical protein [Brucella intermedia]